MALKLIKQLLNEQEEECLLSGNAVIDATTGKSFSDHANDKAIHLTASDVEAQIAPLTKTVNDFLTGDPDGGEVDRLVELVKAIGDNKDSIDALTAGNHEHENLEILEGLGEDAEGDLTFNGKTLNGETSVAFVAEASATPVFSGRLIMVVEPYEAPAEESAD